jgi:hypothetical protein
VRVKYWEIIHCNLKKRGWSLGYVSAVDSQGRTIWIVDAHRGDGRRFIVHSDEKLSAFVELESAITRTLSVALSRYQELHSISQLMHSRIRCFKQNISEQRLRRAQRCGEAVTLGRRANS